MSAPVSSENLRIVAGQESLSLYQFNTRVAKHYFCKTCGIYTFHGTRKDPNLYRVNIGCLEDVDPFSLDVGLNDGAALSVVSAA
jgi:hypothetical protein